MLREGVGLGDEGGKEAKGKSEEWWRRRWSAVAAAAEAG